MSNNFKSLIGKYSSSSPRERLMVLALAGAIAIAGAYLLTMPDDMPNTAGNPLPAKSVVKSSTAKPAANSPKLAMAQEQGVRNPFLPPAEFQQVDSKDMPQDKMSQPGTLPGQLGQGTTSAKPQNDYSNLDKLLTGTGKPTSTKMQDDRPGLVGIVEGAGKRLAIITYGGDSRSYGIYERVGAYQVTSISGSSVILSGPAGRTMLAVGR